MPEELFELGRDPSNRGSSYRESTVFSFGEKKYCRISIHMPKFL